MATIASRIYTKWKRAAAALGFIVRTSQTSVLASDPTISAGSGVPSEAEPNGSIYLRTNGTVYVRTGGTWVSIQATDAELSALAALTSAADKVPYYTGSGTAALATLTAFARTFIDDADAATARATLGLVPGTDVQAQDATLQSLAALGTAADKIAYTTGIDTWAEAAITAVGRTWLAKNNDTEQRAALGVLPASDLASTANGAGASLVGIEDAGSLFTAANVEAALAEVKTLSNAALCRPVISIGAEAGDAIAVTIQLRGINGVNVAREQLLEVWFICTDPDVMFTAAPTGTLLGAGGNRAYVRTDATGLAVMTLTDTTPNYAGTGGLIVTPMSDGTDAFVGFPAFTTATFA